MTRLAIGVSAGVHWRARILPAPPSSHVSVWGAASVMARLLGSVRVVARRYAVKTIRNSNASAAPPLGARGAEARWARRERKGDGSGGPAGAPPWPARSFRAAARAIETIGQ